MLSVSLNTLDPTRLSSHAYTAYLGRGSAASRGETACLSENKIVREAELDSTWPQAIVTNRKAEQGFLLCLSPLQLLALLSLFASWQSN